MKKKEFLHAIEECNQVPAFVSPVEHLKIEKVPWREKDHMWKKKQKPSSERFVADEKKPSVEKGLEDWNKNQLQRKEQQVQGLPSNPEGRTWAKVNPYFQDTTVFEQP